MTEDSAPYTVTPRAYEPPTEEKKAFLAALAKAQGAYEPIVKNAHVRIVPRDKPAYEFDYADLAEIIGKTRKALSENGLSYRCTMSGEEGGVWLASILAHAEGHEDVSTIFISYGEDIKVFGGRVSYMRRYIVGPQFGIASEHDIEDNGVAAGEIGFESRGSAPPARKTPQPKPKPAGTLRGELAGAPTEPPDAGMATSDAALAEVAGQPPADAQADTKPISSGQAKWISGKLSAYYTPEESAAWLKERGIDSVEHVPASRFEALRAELVAL